MANLDIENKKIIPTSRVEFNQTTIDQKFSANRPHTAPKESGDSKCIPKRFSL